MEGRRSLNALLAKPVTRSTMYKRRRVFALAPSSFKVHTSCIDYTTARVTQKLGFASRSFANGTGPGPKLPVTENEGDSWVTNPLPRPRKNEKMKQIFDQFLASAVRTQEEVRNLRIQNPRGVFVNYTMNMKEVNVFGFDYDYTMANYR